MVKKVIIWTAKFIVLPLAILLLTTVFVLILLRLYAQRKVAREIRISAPRGIHSIEKVKLGGLDQSIQIRGEDRSKPILLFLHGGPGFPQMPFSHLNAELEKHFVVVQWDQRGAGKSYSWSIPKETMRIERFVADTHDLVQMLLRRFRAPKCYLVAHSWGSMFGALTVARYPELFYAYVGIGQVAGVPETQQVRYHFALDSARKENNQEALNDLARIGRPPHVSFANCRVMEKWIDHYARARHEGISPKRMVGWALESPAYSWLDLIKIPLGARFSFDALWRELFYHFDLFKEAPRLEVPVYLFLGRYDEVVTAQVAERYFNALDAPRGKHLVWFENSGHWPQFEERKKYRDALIDRVLPETLR